MVPPYLILSPLREARTALCAALDFVDGVPTTEANSIARVLVDLDRIIVRLDPDPLTAARCTCEPGDAVEYHGHRERCPLSR